MSVSEMDQGEPGCKEDKIEDIIEPNHNGNNLAVSLQLPLASDSNNHTNRESEHLHGTFENTNDNQFYGGHGQVKKRDAHLMGSNIQVDFVPQSKVPRLNVLSLATISNNDRAHPEGASVCTNSNLQMHNDLPNFSAVTADKTGSAATTPIVSKDIELTVTSDVDELNQNDHQKHSIALDNSKINKEKELIRSARYGTNDELNNLLGLCMNKISSQLLQVTLESSLIQAVRRGQEFKVQQLVYAGAQPANNYKDQDGYTALLVAAENGFTDIARFLLEKGASVNIINNNNDSALILSVKTSGSTDLVTLLLSHKANVNLQNKYGFTALMKALETRDFDTCKLLVDAGADVNMSSRDGTALMQLVKLECVINACRTALNIMKLLLQNGSHTYSEIACKLNVLCVTTKTGCPDMVRLLCEHGVELNKIHDNQTALMIASEFGHLSLLEILLDHGASVDIQNNKRLNSLLIALKFGQVDCAKLLLSRGARLDLPTAAKLTVENKQSAAFQFLASRYKIDVNKDNLLYLAVEMGMEDIVSILINMGADVNKVDSYGKTPLVLAVMGQSRESLINCLIQNGANVNGNEKFVPLRWSVSYGKTPLALAVMGQSGESLIKCLIQNGARVNGNEKSVPLHWSVHYSFEITKLLLDSGADVNARENVDEDTALIVTCDKGLDIEIVKLLLAKGAQPNLQNKLGFTALHKATLQANVDLVQLLVESGADLEIQTHNNKTAYLLAAGNIKLIEALQTLGANTSAVDSLGYNALMLAVQFAQINCEETCSIKTLTSLYLAGNMAQINHQCNKGYTALMMAAKARNFELMKTLLDLGAEVNISASDGPSHNITALSILLDTFNYDTLANDFLNCFEELLRRGAVNSLPKSCNDVLHKTVASNRRHMTQLLLTNGMAPTMVRLQTLEYRHHLFRNMCTLEFTEVSPLTMALVCENARVAQYLVGNWALCPCDLNLLSLNKLRDFLVTLHKYESVEIVDKLLCQPASLLQLSFITVSHALGGVPERENRINSLPLPQVIREKLMFCKEAVQIDLTEDFSVLNLDDSYSDHYYEANDFLLSSSTSNLDDFDDSYSSSN